MHFEAMKAPSGIRAGHGHSYQSIERIALEVRQRIASDLRMDKALPGVRVLDRIDQHTVLEGLVGLEVAIARLHRGVEAETYYDATRGRIVIALSEETNALFEMDDERARFTFAHELGHGFLHAPELLEQGEIIHQMAALRRGESLRHPKYYDTEWQADAFAAALLMPALGLELLAARVAPLPLTWKMVAEVFKVSGRAAKYRLDNFQLRRERLLCI